MCLTTALAGRRIPAIVVVVVATLATSTTVAPVVSVVMGQGSITRAMRRGSSTVRGVPVGTLALGRHRSREVALLFIVSFEVEELAQRLVVGEVKVRRLFDRR